MDKEFINIIKKYAISVPFYSIVLGYSLISTSYIIYGNAALFNLSYNDIAVSAVFMIFAIIRNFWIQTIIGVIILSFIIIIMKYFAFESLRFAKFVAISYVAILFIIIFALPAWRPLLSEKFPQELQQIPDIIIVSFLFSFLVGFIVPSLMYEFRKSSFIILNIYIICCTSIYIFSIFSYPVIKNERNDKICHEKCERARIDYVFDQYVLFINEEGKKITMRRDLISYFAYGFFEAPNSSGSK